MFAENRHRLANVSFAFGGMINVRRQVPSNLHECGCDVVLIAQRNRVLLVCRAYNVVASLTSFAKRPLEEGLRRQRIGAANQSIRTFIQVQLGLGVRNELDEVTERGQVLAEAGDSLPGRGARATGR